MDLVCLILWIIDLAKPSVGLSVAAIVAGFIDLYLLVLQRKKFSIAYVVSIIGLIIGVYKICSL